MKSVIPNMMMDTFQKVFGIPCIYRNKAGDEFQISGIFDDKSMTIDPATGHQILTSQPKLDIKIGDLPLGLAIKRDEFFVVHGKTYKVREFRSDGISSISVILYE